MEASPELGVFAGAWMQNAQSKESHVGRGLERVAVQPNVKSLTFEFSRLRLMPRPHRICLSEPRNKPSSVPQPRSTQRANRKVLQGAFHSCPSLLFGRARRENERTSAPPLTSSQGRLGPRIRKGSEMGSCVSLPPLPFPPSVPSLPSLTRSL